jgi:hypothetical protein
MVGFYKTDRVINEAFCLTGFYSFVVATADKKSLWYEFLNE